MIFLSLLSSFLNAVNTLYAKKITLEIKDNNSFIVATFAIVGFFLAMVMPWFYSFKATPASISLVVVVIMLDTLANILFFLCMERIEVSRLAVYLALTPMFTFLPNIALHGFSLHAMTSVLFIVIGIYLLNMNGKSPITPIVELKKPGNLLGLLTAVAYGVSMVPTQQLLVHEWINAPTLYLFRAWGIAVLIYALYRPKIWYPKAAMHLSFRGLLVIIQWLCLFTALREADGTLVVSLAYTSPLFAVFLSRIYFKERITTGKLAACCITILGILWTIS